MIESLGNKILVLRYEGKTYDEIKNELGCSKSTVSYHCNRSGLINKTNKKIDKSLIKIIKEYYKTHTTKETANKFNVGLSTVVKYTTNKSVRLTTEEKRIRNLERVKKRRKDVKEKAIIYLGGECNRCGYDKCNDALEFHHIDPDLKEFGIASQGHTRSWEKVKRELDKCLMVCANCHREIHSELRNNPK